MSERCASCRNTLTDTVILECSHNVCIPCAAKDIQPSASGGYEIPCSLCHTRTTLEPAAANELLSIRGAAPQGGLNTKICGQCENSVASLECLQCMELFCEPCSLSTHKRGRMAQHKVLSIGLGGSNAAQPTVQVHENADFRCPDHPDEEVSYFCLDCESSCVCTECVVHGRHKNHDVHTLRKSFPIIKQRAENLLMSLQSRIDDLAVVEQKIESHRKEILDNTLSIKDTMAKSFNEVRDRIRKKEDELMSNADQSMTEQMVELDNFIKATREKNDEMDDCAGNVRKIMDGPDEVALLNFYAENKGRILDLISSKVSSRQAQLDVASCNQQIDGLRGLHLIIATLRGPEDGASPQRQGR